MAAQRYIGPAQFLEDPNSHAGFKRHVAQLPDGPNKTWLQTVLDTTEVAVEAGTSVADALQQLRENT